jgi:hypothetical protein
MNNTLIDGLMMIHGICFEYSLTMFSAKDFVNVYVLGLLSRILKDE